MADAGRRIGIVDFLRGVVIVDMMLVHYVDALPSATLRKVVLYTDVAMEGFLSLAGFTVGYHLLERYRRDPRGTARALLGRAAGLYGFHALMVLTISLPLALAFGARVSGGEGLGRYLLSLLLLVRQEGLMHILPTFVPLFVAAIPMLSLVSRGRSWPVLLGSVLLFLAGSRYPRALSLGAPSIFPVALWQLYFVLGLLLGAGIRERRRAPFTNIASCAAVAAAAFCLAAWWQFGHHLAPWWWELQVRLQLYVRRFPLNALGVVYGSSLLALLVCGAVAMRRQIEGNRAVEHTLSLLGRHSLTAFLIHVYFARAASAAAHLASFPRSAVTLLIVANIPFTLLVLHLRERRPL